MPRNRDQAIVLVATILAIATPAFSNDVNTIVGTGAQGFSGDNGPALAATIQDPRGIAVANDGSIYFADSGNFRIRKVTPGGIISTIVGNGIEQYAGDDGPGTAASISGLLSIALNPANDRLYIADLGNNVIRVLDLGTGIITRFAGISPLDFGDQGNDVPALTASLGFPEGVAVGPDGTVYIADTLDCEIRSVDTSGIIHLIGGDPFACDGAGEGVNVSTATFSLPARLATNAAGDLFVVDTGIKTIRKIDHATHIITTVAGGGSTPPGFGLATDMNLGDVTDAASDTLNHLYITAQHRVFRLDLSSGFLSVFAGTGVPGFSGDGGPADAAQFNNVFGVGVRGDAVIISDGDNARLRSVAPPPPVPGDLIIQLTTSQAFLDAVNAVVGSVIIVNVDGRDLLIIPNMASVGVNVTVTDNDQLLVVDLSALASVGGSIDISGNLALQSVDLGALTSVGGSLTVSDNPALSGIIVSGVVTIGGDLTVIGTAASVINVSMLQTVAGSIDISNNANAGVIDGGALTGVGGDIRIDNNPNAGVINVSNLETVAGAIDLSDNASVGTIDLGALGSVGGDVNIADNTSVGTLDLGALLGVGGSLDISGNTDAGNVNLADLSSVGGDITIVDNGDASVNVSGLNTVAGSIDIDTTGTGVFDIGADSTGGTLDLTTTGYDRINGATADGDTNITAVTLDAITTLHISAASFTAPVAFSLTHLDPASLVPEQGTAVDGNPATIEPIVGYQFNFATPVLNHEASLSFDVNLAGLDAASQADILNALASGTATMVTRPDAAGGTYQAFPICVGVQTPSPDGCVVVEALDASGNPTTGTPAVIRFSNVVGHFSSWAVAIVDEVVPATQTPTATVTVTTTPTPTATGTPTNTSTETPSHTPTNTLTATPSRTATQTPTSTNTSTTTPSPTRTATVTAIPTNTATATPTNTATKTRTPTITRTATPSASPTQSPTATPTVAPPPPTTCGDIDGDGRVTLSDGLLEALAVLFGRKNPRYDINHDGQVNIDDLLIVGSQIGKSCWSGG